MRTKLTALIGLMAATAMSGGPAASYAEPIAKTTYSTTLMQTGPLPSGGAYTGTLELTLSPAGIASGWYIPDFQTTFVPVVGGLEHGKLWLDIGRAGQVKISATVDGKGRLVGSALEPTPVPWAPGGPGFPVTFDFVASPKSL